MVNSSGSEIYMKIPFDEQCSFAQDAPREQNKQVTMFQFAKEKGSSICDPLS
jgi:hypothetical protein